jgi:hypothetical protein
MESHRNEQLQDNSKMLSVTRIHKGSSSCMAPVPKVLEFVRNAMQFADSVLICVSLTRRFIFNVCIARFGGTFVE